MDPFSCSGSSPSSTLCRDSWLTIDGIVPIERGKQHKNYFVPEAEKPSKQYGLDLGHVRVSVLGTKDGSVLHFEFKSVNPGTSRLIVDAIQQSRAVLINLEFHCPRYTLRSNLSPQAAISFLQETVPPTTNLDLVFENHFSLFLIRPVSSTGQSWLDENVGGEDTLTFGNAIVCEHRYVEAIFRGATADGLACR
jgi:hypothetical protein